METLQISLAAARVNAELTQEEVAKNMKVSKNTVVSWEKGLSEPSITQGRMLSALYKIPLDNIFYLVNQIKFDLLERLTNLIATLKGNLIHFDSILVSKKGVSE